MHNHFSSRLTTLTCGLSVLCLLVLLYIWGTMSSKLILFANAAGAMKASNDYKDGFLCLYKDTKSSKNMTWDTDNEFLNYCEYSIFFLDIAGRYGMRNYAKSYNSKMKGLYEADKSGQSLKMNEITLDAFLVALKEKIEVAFKDVKYPGDDNIAQKDWYLEDENLAGYIGRKREDVTVDFINDGHRSCATFMTREAYHYYLPTFLLLCAEYAEETDVFSDNIIDDLMYPLKEDYENILKMLHEEFGTTPEEACISPSNEQELKTAQNEFLSFIKMLSKQQREAVYYFLIYYQNKYGYGGQTALNRFWQKFKEQNFEFDFID